VDVAIDEADLLVVKLFELDELVQHVVALAPVSKVEARTLEINVIYDVF